MRHRQRQSVEQFAIGAYCALVECKSRIHSSHPWSASPMLIARRLARRRFQPGGSTMNIRPDPTFYASPKLAMEAPPENFAYTLLLSPDFSKPDALAVIDVKRGSPTFSRIV